MAQSSLSTIFSLVLREGPLSRVDMAARTGLTRAAVGGLVDDLRERGLVEEGGRGRSSGGRPPTLLTVKPGAYRVLGAALYEHRWLLIDRDLAGPVLDHIEIPTASDSPHDAFAALLEGVGRIRSVRTDIPILPAIGVGAPGLVDMDANTIISAHDLGWGTVPLGSMIEEATGLTAYISNRSKVAALAEYRHYRGRYRNLVSITLGTGVAAGVIVDGSLYRGASGGSGELGHVPIVPNGPPCACGNRGCLQALVGEDEILRRGRLLAERYGVPVPEDPSELIRRAEKGEEAFISVYEELADYLGSAVGLVVNLINPELLVLGGPIIDHAEGLFERVKERAALKAMPHLWKETILTRSAFGDEASAVGGASLVLERVPELLFG